MPKALIIGPSFFLFNQNVASSLSQLGWNVEIESYDEPIHPFKGILKWIHKFSFNRKALKEKHIVKYQKYISTKFLNFNPNLVLVLNGAILKYETLTFFRQTAKVVLWMYDSVFRFPKCIQHIDYVDFAFYYEKNDVEYYNSLGKKAYFLPQAADETIYHPIECTKTIDILFVGVLYNYKKRINILKSIVEKFSTHKIVIVGKYKPIEKNIIKWLFREKRHIYTNQNVSPSEVNKLYNQSNVVINIHHETQVEGANPKVFEICSSGVYQICDYNPYIVSIFPNGEVGLYKNIPELFDLIEDAIRSDKSEQAKKAQKIVIENHTFKHRIEEMLKITGLNLILYVLCISSLC